MWIRNLVISSDNVNIDVHNHITEVYVQVHDEVVYNTSTDNCGGNLG